MMMIDARSITDALSQGGSNGGGILMCSFHTEE